MVMDGHGARRLQSGSPILTIRTSNSYRKWVSYCHFWVLSGFNFMPACLKEFWCFPTCILTHIGMNGWFWLKPRIIMLHGCCWSWWTVFWNCAKELAIGGSFGAWCTFNTSDHSWPCARVEKYISVWYILYTPVRVCYNKRWWAGQCDTTFPSLLITGLSKIWCSTVCWYFWSIISSNEWRHNISTNHKVKRFPGNVHNT